MAIPQPPLQRRGADISPALVQALRGLLDGVILSIAVAGILIVQKHITQGEHRRHPFSVLLDVTLQVLNMHTYVTDILHFIKLLKDKFAYFQPALYCYNISSICK